MDSSKRLNFSYDVTLIEKETKTSSILTLQTADIMKHIGFQNHRYGGGARVYT